MKHGADPDLVIPLVIIGTILSFIALGIFAATEEHRVSNLCEAAGYDRSDAAIFTNADICIKTTVREQTVSAPLESVLNGE